MPPTKQAARSSTKPSEPHLHKTPKSTIARVLKRKHRQNNKTNVKSKPLEEDNNHDQGPISSRLRSRTQRATSKDVAQKIIKTDKIARRIEKKQRRKEKRNMWKQKVAQVAREFGDSLVIVLDSEDEMEAYGTVLRRRRKVK